MDSQEEFKIIWNLLSSLGIGILIGIERGWSGRLENEGDRIAGIRTFSLVGLLGGVWGVMSGLVNDWILGVVFLAFTALIIAAHLVETKVHYEKDIGITTEIALLLTFSLGAWAAMGFHIYALGSAVIVVALLSLKPVLHHWLTIIEVKEIYAGIQLLIISVILLPLLPNQGFGPWNALNPYWIWWMVVLISGLSFLGYILIKYRGGRQGTLLTALTGGLASSTAVTLSFAQMAKAQKKVSVYLFTAGVLFASSIMFIRVAIEVAIVNPGLLYPLWIPLVVMLITTAGSGFWLWKKHQDGDHEQPVIEIQNPLNLFTAIQFGLLLGVILLLASALQDWYGDKGIYLLSFFSGLMDVDAITLSLSRMAQSELTVTTASLGIVISIITNTLVKAGLFIFWIGYEKSKYLLYIVLFISAISILSLLPFIG